MSSKDAVTFSALFHWPTRTEHYPDAERISNLERVLEGIKTPSIFHAAMLLGVRITTTAGSTQARAV